MSDSTSKSGDNSLTFEDVRLEELVAIDERRKALGLVAAQNAEDDERATSIQPTQLTVWQKSINLFLRKKTVATEPEQKPTQAQQSEAKKHADNLIGLALSGGGIRSASFNLGLIQSLHKLGILRHIDIMSTVSGGGYIGATVSSTASTHNSKVLPPDSETTGPEASQPKSKAWDENNFPLSNEETGQQKERVGRFLRNGKYMFAGVEDFMVRYLFGLIVNAALAFCMLVFVGCSLSLVWRLFDMPAVHDFVKDDVFGAIHAEHLITDLTRAFLPSLLLFFCCLVSLVSPKLLKWSVQGFIASILVGGVIVLGNGDISGTHLVHQQLMWLVATLGIVLLVALLPAMSPRKLLQSGTHGAGELDRLLFRVTTTALFFGVPLFFVYLIGREDFCGTAKSRTVWTEQDIRDWTFVDEVHQRSKEASLTNSRRPPEVTELETVPEQVAESLGTRPWITRAELYPAANETAHKQESPPNSLTPNEIRDRTDAYRKKKTAELNGFVDNCASSPSTLAPFAEEVATNSFWTVVDEVEKTILAARDKEYADQRVVYAAGLSREQKQELIKLAVVINARVNQDAEVERKDVARFIRLYSEARYPHKVFNRRRILRRNCIVADQKWRLIGMAGAVLIGLVIAGVGHPNTTSIHRYYRDRLTAAYIDDESYNENRGALLKHINATEQGAPLHLINATVNFLGTVDSSNDFRTANENSVDSSRTFTFSPIHCGWGSNQYCHTSRYVGGSYDLGDAVAVSGGAVSPAMTTNRLVLALMFVFNLRLGQWLPHPNMPSVDKHPSYLDLLIDLIRRQCGWPTMYCFMSDGGHRENLGLAPLLNRRCRLIVVSDAGRDPEHTFEDLIKIYRFARSRFGTRFLDPESDEPMSLEDLKLKFSSMLPDNRSSSDLGETNEHFVAVRVVYGQSSQSDSKLKSTDEGLLVYLKPSMNGDEEVDLLQYRLANPQFPHHPTSQVAFDENQFESYRQLGEHIGEDVFEYVKPKRLWRMNCVDGLAHLEEAVRRRARASAKATPQHACVPEGTILSDARNGGAHAPRKAR